MEFSLEFTPPFSQGFSIRDSPGPGQEEGPHEALRRTTLADSARQIQRGPLGQGCGMRMAQGSLKCPSGVFKRGKLGNPLKMEVLIGKSPN